MANRGKIGGLHYFMDLPSDMKRYIRHFGLHFNSRLYEFAVSKMERKIKGSDRTERMKPIDKSKFEELLKKYNIKTERELHQFVSTFVLNNNLIISIQQINNKFICHHFISPPAI